MGSVVCAAGGDQGFTAEIVAAYHQNEPDVGVVLARQWMDRDGVDMLLDMPTAGGARGHGSGAGAQPGDGEPSGGTADLTGAQW